VPTEESTGVPMTRENIVEKGLQVAPVVLMVVLCVALALVVWAYKIKTAPRAASVSSAADILLPGNNLHRPESVPDYFVGEDKPFNRVVQGNIRFGTPEKPE